MKCAELSSQRGHKNLDITASLAKAPLSSSHISFRAHAGATHISDTASLPVSLEIWKSCLLFLSLRSQHATPGQLSFKSARNGGLRSACALQASISRPAVTCSWHVHRPGLLAIQLPCAAIGQWLAPLAVLVLCATSSLAVPGLLVRKLPCADTEMSPACQLVWHILQVFREGLQARLHTPPSRVPKRFQKRPSPTALLRLLRKKAGGLH